MTHTEWTAMDIIKAWWVKYIPLVAMAFCIVLLLVTKKPEYNTVRGRLTKATRTHSKSKKQRDSDGKVISSSRRYFYSVKVSYFVDDQPYSVKGEIESGKSIYMDKEMTVYFRVDDPANATLNKPTWYFRKVVLGFLLVFFLATVALFMSGAVADADDPNS